VMARRRSSGIGISLLRNGGHHNPNRYGRAGVGPCVPVEELEPGGIVA
jgi:hypothetical protein